MKIKFVILFIFIGVSFHLSTYAQDARQILDKASATYNNAGGITANFTLETKDIKSQNTFSYDGKAFMKGNKFKIDTPDATTWFNGATQWVYVKDMEEVNISTPTTEELQSISPSVLFSIYKKGFNLKLKGEKKVFKNLCYEIEMTSQKKKADIPKIIVYIDKTTYTFAKIVVIDKSAMENILLITKYQTGLDLADSIFQFDKKNYPKADIIDLR